MAFNILKTLPRSMTTVLNNKIISRSYIGGLWEPDYLDVGKPIHPMYPLLNVRIRAYTFPVLEKFQRQIHNIAEHLNMDVEDSWAFPAKITKVKLYKVGTTTIENEYILNTYERNTQISNVSSITAPILIRMLEASLPEGVNLNVSEFDPAIEERRYVPDKEMLDLKAELEVISKSKK